MQPLQNKIFTFFGSVVFFLLLILLCYLSFSPIPTRHTPGTVEQKVKALHETAAVWVPHLDIDKGKIRQAHLSLFEKVEQGQLLSDDESREYRHLYQTLLLQHQSFFSRFDSQLAAITNLAMDQPNNVGGHGVEGHHDHHDQSSRNNFFEIENAYTVLEKKSFQKNMFFSLDRVKYAIFIYKDLNDILFHLATVPHTKSIHYHPVDGKLTIERQRFETMLYDFKAAQFMSVNSAEYQQKIRAALNEYENLVMQSEKIVHQHLSVVELKLVGYWSGWQSLTPKVNNHVKQTESLDR